MRRGLNVIDKYKGNAAKSAAVLNTLATAYSTLMMALGTAGDRLSVKGILKATAFIIISPVLILFMKWGLKIVSNTRVQAAIISGSVTLGIMATAYLGFAGALVAIAAVVSIIPIFLLVPFIGIVALSGLALAGIGLLLPLIIPGAIAAGLIAVSLLVLSASMLIVGLSLLALALIFVAIKALIPNEDIIDLTVKTVVMMIRGVGKILRAIKDNLKLGTALLGVIVLALVLAIMVLLLVNAVIFLVLGTVSTLITLEMIDAVTQLVYQEGAIVKLIVDNIDPVIAIIALIDIALVTVVIALLMVTAIFTLMLAGICSLIDFKKLDKNLGTGKGSKEGLIPILGSMCWKLFTQLPPIIILIAAIARITMVLGIVAMLSIVALMVKGLATLEVQEYDSTGHRVGEKVKMSESDFETAKTNIEKIIDVIISPFISKDGKPTELVKRLQKLRTGGIKRVMKDLSAVVKSISSMSRTVAKISKMIVPDEEKGFDKDGKPNGWRQLAEQDFEKFRDNTNILVETLVGIFDPKTEQGKAFLRVMRRVDAGSKKKMRFISNIVGTIGNMSGIVSKMSNMLTPDTEQDGWMNKEGKIVKWRKLENSDFVKATENMMTIVKFLCDPDGDSLLSAIKDSDIENMKMRTLKKFNLIMSSMEPISELIKTIIDLSTGIFPVAELDENKHAKFDSKGNQIMKYLKFEEIDFKGAAQKISLIVKQYLYELRKVFSDGYYQNAIKDVNKYMKDGLPTTGISDLIDHIVKIGTGQFPIIDLDKNGKPIGYNKDGSPKMRYLNFDNSLITTATQNIATIIKSYVNELYKVVSEVGEDATGFAVKMTTLNTVFNGPNSIFSFITPLINNTQKIVAIKDKEVETFPTKLSTIISAYISAIGLFESNSFDVWRSVREQFIDFVSSTSRLYRSHAVDNIPKNIAQTFSSTEKFLDKVNKTDPSKLEKMADISKNMATFAVKINGNFDGLAKAMNENIITALDKVEQSMKDLKDFLENDFTKNLTDGVSNAVSNINVSSSGEKEPKDEKVVKDKKKEQLPDNKQKENDKSKEREIKTVQQLVSALRGCINDNTINVKIK